MPLKNNNLKPLVSVIISTFNRSQLICELLNSVLFQTYSNWECVIIDNTSTDNTFKVIENYLKKDNRFIFFKRDKNQLAHKKRGDYNCPRADFIKPLEVKVLDKQKKICLNHKKIITLLGNFLLEGGYKCSFALMRYNPFIVEFHEMDIVSLNVIDEISNKIPEYCSSEFKVL